MSFKSDPRQTLFLWTVLFEHKGSVFNQDLRPEVKKIKAGQRDALVSAGLLEKEKIGKKLRFTLTEAGWAWAGKNLASKISKSRAAAPVLHAILTSWSDVMANGGTISTLADLFLKHPAPESEKKMLSPQTGLPERIRSYWLQVTGGRRDQPVRLAQLRQELADVAQPQLDAILVELHKNGGLVLASLESYRQITAADKSAAITIAGKANHIFYME